MNVGFVGLGYMGTPMANRMLNAGHTLMVYDVDPARTEELRGGGALVGANPAAVGAASEVVFIALSSVEASKAVILDESTGLLATMGEGSTIIELSTASWRLTKEFAASASKRGVAYLDSPVSAAGGPAAEGKLTLMVGGDPAVIERCRPALSQLGTIYPTGPVGSGVAAKLVTQYIGYTAQVAGLEAIVFAEKAGVALETLFEIIPVSAARQAIAARTLDDIKRRDFGDPAAGRTPAPVYIIEKDLRLALEFADDLEVSAETGRLGHDLLVEAEKRGWDDYSWYRIIELLEERAKLD